MNEYMIVSAIIKYKDKYLIGKRSENKKFAPGKWELISGFIDKPLSKEEIILEELKEELKLEGKIIKVGNMYEIKDKEGNWKIIPILIEVNTNQFTINKKDHSEVIWISKDELDNYEDVAEDIKNIKSQGLI